MKLIGLKDVNQICIPRLNRYLPGSLSQSEAKKPKQDKVDSEKEKSEKVADEKDGDGDVEMIEENEDQDLEDRFQLLEKGIYAENVKNYYFTL